MSGDACPGCFALSAEVARLRKALLMAVDHLEMATDIGEDEGILDEEDAEGEREIIAELRLHVTE